MKYEKSREFCKGHFLCFQVFRFHILQLEILTEKESRIFFDISIVFSTFRDFLLLLASSCSLFEKFRCFVSKFG